MHLDEAGSKLLKTWITKRLDDISDADSDVLADYVLALVNTDVPDAAAKATVVASLVDFVPNKTERFVDELFQAIVSGSYDPNRPIATPTAQTVSPLQNAHLERTRQLNPARKRGPYHDWDSEEQANGSTAAQEHGARDRPRKQLKRGGKGREHRGGRQGPAALNGMSTMSSLPTVVPPLDPNDPLAAFMAMQQAMSLFAGPPAERICSTFATHGFCDDRACEYKHQWSTLEYDPINPNLPDVKASRSGAIDISKSKRGRGRANGRGRGVENWRGGGKRSEYSQLGPGNNPFNATIMVEQIPDDRCNEQDVRQFFSVFGEIQEIFMEPMQKLAMVTYANPRAAYAAYNSPKAIFDNRFVKVYMKRSERSLGAPARDAAVNGPTDDTEMANVEKFDPAEFARRQEEMQKKYEEAQKQREEAARQMQDVNARLIQMETQRKELEAMLAKRIGIEDFNEASKENGAENNEQTMALKVQLAQLEAEAMSLGIDPDAASTNGFVGSAYRGVRGRGRYRGRGRGSYRGFRGGWAGGSRVGAVMRLDNRPKTVSIKFSDGNYESHEEAIRQYLLFNGLDNATISKHQHQDDVALVTFEHRFEGENFMAAAAGSELPHIGKVELSWCSKSDEPIATTNGIHDTEKDRIIIDGASDQDASEVKNGEVEYEEAEEDLDRWS